jgi:hypothetical protein
MGFQRAFIMVILEHLKILYGDYDIKYFKILNILPAHFKIN